MELHKVLQLISCLQEKTTLLRMLRIYLPLSTTTKASIETRFHQALQDLNSTSQEGLRAMFDSTVGGNTVLFPFSGTYLKTPVQGMVAKLPVLQGNYHDCKYHDPWF